MLDSEASLTEILQSRLSNILQVPTGGEEEAKILREFGTVPEFSFPAQDHLQIGERLGLIDFETGGIVSGRKFVYLKRGAALLELALCNYALQKVVAKGFVPMMTPDLVRDSVLKKCGFQPRATNTQVCLRPSSLAYMSSY